ncbi:hypothetical protein H8E77_24470 [bacterium]|nr:hypothetical protein [bacterium]
MNGDIIAETTEVLENHNADDGWDALTTLYADFLLLDDFAATLIELLNDSDIGPVASATLQNYNDQVRSQLETVDQLYVSTLTFEFSPHGLEFLIPAELVVPCSQVCISDDLFFYSDDGEIVEPTEIDYFIDDVNETYHFLIDHFSSYYYPRR